MSPTRPQTQFYTRLQRFAFTEPLAVFGVDDEFRQMKERGDPQLKSADVVIVLRDDIMCLELVSRSKISPTSNQPTEAEALVRKVVQGMNERASIMDGGKEGIAYEVTDLSPRTKVPVLDLTQG